MVRISLNPVLTFALTMLFEQVDPRVHRFCFMTSRPSAHLRPYPVGVRAVCIDLVAAIHAGLYLNGAVLVLGLRIVRIRGAHAT